MQLRIDIEKIRKFQFVNTATYLFSVTQTMYSPILFRSILFYLSAIIKTILYNKAYNIRMPLYAFADGPRGHYTRSIAHQLAVQRQRFCW